ncbi:hypothetical protein PG995_014096 [Apiospora arundinis]
MPPIPESPASLAPPQATSNSPTEDYIPIIHKRVPTKIQTQGLAPPEPTNGGPLGILTTMGSRPSRPPRALAPPRNRPGGGSPPARAMPWAFP